MRPDAPFHPYRCIALVLALLMPLGVLADPPRLALNAGIHLIHAEVANDFTTRARGLMYRETLGTNDGMLFVFPAVERHCMWMRNTYLPLSVAFLDDAGTVINIEDMAPRTEDHHCAARPARYALEMNRGWFAARGVGPGTKIGGLVKAPAPE